MVYVLSYFVNLCISKTVFPKTKLYFGTVIFGYLHRVFKIKERNFHISVSYLTGLATCIYLQCDNAFENSITSSVDKALADLAAR